MKKLFVLFAVLFLASCDRGQSIIDDVTSKLPAEVTQDEPTSIAADDAVVTVPVTFRLVAAEKMNVILARRGEDDIYVEIETYPLTYSDGEYFTTVDIQPNTLFEYMYIKDLEFNRTFELNSLGQEMYRTAYVTETAEIIDYWDKEYTSTAKVTVTDGEHPLRDIVVDTNGLRKITMQDGTATIETATIGSLVTVYDLEGRFKPKSVILTENTTITMEPSTFTTVTFKVKNNSEFDLIRVAGMVGQMGYKYLQENRRFFDNDGRQLLELTEQDGYYVGSVELPVNQVFTYAYTIGTQRIGVEMDDWKLVSKDVLVTEHMVIEDDVSNFKRPNEVYITFDPNVDERINLRFEHLTVSFIDKITVPVEQGITLEYRYQTSVEDFTSEYLGNRTLDDFGYPEYRSVQTDTSKVLNDTIAGWNTYEDSEIHAQIPDTVRPVFTALMMYDYWTSSDFNDYEDIYPTIKELNPDYVFLSPIWNYSDINTLPRLEATGYEIGSVAIPDADLRHFLDITDLPVGFHQQDNPEMAKGDDWYDEFFHGGEKSDEWWDEYLSEIRRFTLYHAAVAEEYDIKFIKFPDTFIGETLGYFKNIEQVQKYDAFMVSLLADVREIYSGTIYAPAIIYSNFEYHYTYLEQVDYLSNKFWYDPLDLDYAETRFLEELSQYESVVSEYGVPFMIDQLHFVKDGMSIEDPINELIPAFYDKMFGIINEEEWIEGVVLFGYPYAEGASMITTANTVIKEWFEAFKG